MKKVPEVPDDSILGYCTAMRKKHVSHAGPDGWDILPDSLKQSESLQIFKSCLKLYFFSLYN